MQFINLKKQYEILKPDIDRRIQSVLNHGQYILGPEVAELESYLADYAGVNHCIAVANGTDALLIAMMALGIKPGDEVITTPFTFIATGEMIALLGATPIFVDIDERTYNIDVNKIREAISNKTKCIMPVSLYGQCADMDEINNISLEYNLCVIEDAAQSFGATYKNKKSCSLSTIGCTSFFPSKPLGCYGDGGACFTNDDALAKMMRQIRAHGQEKRYHHPILGMNSRLDTLQAAILLAKLSVFDYEVEERIRIGERYHDLLRPHLKTMHVEPHNTCVYAQYTIEVNNRDAVQTALNKVNVPTAVHYPFPLHLQPLFAETYSEKPSLPVAEKIAKKVLSLPMHPYLQMDEQLFVAQQLLESLSVTV